MKPNLKYLSVALGALLALSGFLPLMSKNGISVNGFHPELGLGLGYWLLGLGGTVALLSFAPQWMARRVATGLGGAGAILALNTCWQGYKLGAIAWGAWVIAAISILLLTVLVIRQIREK